MVVKPTSVENAQQGAVTQCRLRRHRLFFGHLEPMRILRFRGPSCHPIVPLTRFLGRQLDIGVSQDVLGIIDDKVAPVPAMAFLVLDAHALNLQVTPEFVENCVEIRQ